MFMQKFLYCFAFFIFFCMFFQCIPQVRVDEKENSGINERENREDKSSQSEGSPEGRGNSSLRTSTEDWDDSSLNSRDRSCIYDTQDCDSDDEDPPSVNEKYDELKDRYGRGYADLDINPNRVEEFMVGYISNHEITEGRIFVDLDRVNTEKYYRGRIIIALEEEQSDGEDIVHHLRMDSGSADDSEYNVWGSFNGKLGFHGFFSDNKFGSVILVLNEGSDPRKDADGFRKRVRFSDGSIWFMNFKSFTGDNHKDCYEGGSYIGVVGRPPKPSKKCWFIGTGPFDCRAWKTGKKDVNTLRSLEPRDSCYQKLADFDNLNIEEAFNTDHEEDNEIFITRR